MTRTLYLIDTCSFVKQFADPAYGVLFDELIYKGQFVLSAIVAMELYAGTKNKAAKKALDKLAFDLSRVDLLVTPTYQDYQHAGMMLCSYARRKGDLKASSHFRDILISLNALRFNAIVVTENIPDFHRWQHEIKRAFQKNLQVQAGQDFFSYL